jgi:hypothetical protein
MASTYVNDLRLNEMATGDQSGSWGTVTNTNLELIGEAFSYGTEAITTNADTHTTTIADGASDPGRAMFLKYTGALDSACTITIGPNTVSKMWFIENATSGSQNIIISQGSGANVTIAAGQTKAVYSDGAGAGAAFVDAFAALNVAGVSPTEIGVLDGITATTAELNYNDITTLGTVQASKTVTADANGNVSFGDNDKAIFGAGSDLQIYHDGSDSYISDQGTGNIILDVDDSFQVKRGTNTSAYFDTNAEVTLYYNNAIKLATTTTGATVTGDGTSEAILRVDTNSNDKGDYRIRVEDGASFGTMYFEDFAGASWTKNLGLQSNGEVYFYEDGGNAVKFYWDSVNEATVHKDGVKANFGDSSDLSIYHDGSNSYIKDQGTGNLRISSSKFEVWNPAVNEVMLQCVEDGAVRLYHNDAERIATTTTGVNITGTAVTDGVTVDGTLDIEEVFEKVSTGSSTSGTINYDFLGQAIVFFSNNQTGNRTINFIGDGSNALNSVLAIGQSATCSVLLAQGSTAYYLNAYQVDGTAVTPKWSGGSAPTGGNASGIDVYTFTIIKTANATYTVLASQTQFA